MIQKYIVRTVKRFSGLGRCYWLLYRFDPESDTYQFIARYATLGQLLCAMEGDVLENWHFISQTTSRGNGLTVTRYYYPDSLGSGKEGIEVDVIENREARWYDDVTEDKINCSLSPDELHKIASLLHSKRLELHNILNQSKNPIATNQIMPLADELALVDHLGGKIQRFVGEWLGENHHTDHSPVGGCNNDR